MSKSDDRKLEALVRKLSSQEHRPKDSDKARRRYDDTLQEQPEEDRDLQNFFSEMKKREF